MSAVLESDEVPALPAQENVEPKKLEIREGGWRAYRHCLSRSRDEKALATTEGGLLAYQRACALAHLGKRAQLHGGVCSN